MSGKVVEALVMSTKQKVALLVVVLLAVGGWLVARHETQLAIAAERALPGPLHPPR